MRPQLWAAFALIFVSGCFSDPGMGASNNTTQTIVINNGDSNNQTANNGDSNNQTGNNQGSNNGESNNQTVTNGEFNNGGCEPSPEVCDGVDNDCDELVDEGFDIGADCTAGEGACAAVGSTTCNEAGDAVVCDAVPGTPSDELCDDVDNDCDGDVDEDYAELGDGCTEGVGECAVDGTLVCTADGAATECDATPASPPEVNEITCDALDNDCDGEVDEGCDDDADGFCDDQFTVAAGANCTAGDCNDASDAAYPGGPPACDGLDNDCDGATDEVKAAAGTDFAFQLTGEIAPDADDVSPVFSVATTTGFCIAVVEGTPQDRTLQMLSVDVGSQTVVEHETEMLTGEWIADLATNGTDCFVASFVDNGTQALDAYLHRWGGVGSSQVTRTVLNDELYPLTGWNLAIASVGISIVFAFQPQTGTATRYYVLPQDFTSAEPLGPIRDAGITGSYPEIGPNPGPYNLLWFSNIGNLNAYSFDIGGDRVDTGGLDISSASRFDETTVESVGGITVLALHDTSGDFWEVREINQNRAFATTGQTPTYTARDGNDHVNRQLFADGPDGQAAMLEPISDRVLLFDPFATTFTFTPYAGTSRGELNGIRADGPDVLQLLWSTGTTNNNTDFEIADYTCH